MCHMLILVKSNFYFENFSDVLFELFKNPTSNLSNKDKDIIFV